MRKGTCHWSRCRVYNSENPGTTRIEFDHFCQIFHDVHEPSTRLEHVRNFWSFFGLNVLFEKDFTCLHLDYQLQLSEEHKLRRFWQ